MKEIEAKGEAGAAKMEAADIKEAESEAGAEDTLNAEKPLAPRKLKNPPNLVCLLLKLLILRKRLMKLLVSLPQSLQ